MLSFVSTLGQEIPAHLLDEALLADDDAESLGLIHRRFGDPNCWICYLFFGVVFWGRDCGILEASTSSGRYHLPLSRDGTVLHWDLCMVDQESNCSISCWRCNHPEFPDKNMQLEICKSKMFKGQSSSSARRTCRGSKGAVHVAALRVIIGNGTALVDACLAIPICIQMHSGFVVIPARYKRMRQLEKEENSIE